LRNLPEVVKGALFARYSRSPKSLRRLFLDEFLDHVAPGQQIEEVGLERANKLYERIFDDYGDDSVAQLGGAHLACEEASNILTKVLEWGRLMACLEQSTRYIPYTDKRGGRWRYLIPTELDSTRDLQRRYVECLDHAFETYERLIAPLERHYQIKFPKKRGDSESVYKRTIRAKALDTLRGLLPAATQSNVGLFGSGQAFEALLLRMRVHPLAEVRDYASLMLPELRKVIPSFLKRVDRADRGVLWSDYLRATREGTEALADRMLAGINPEPQEEEVEVALTDYDPEGEVKVIAAALYAVSNLPDSQLLAIARDLTTEQRVEVLRTYVGKRENRRHKPGRAFERTNYRFDILTDYGAFRDLQRHRLLTLEWQPLSPRHGYAAAEAIEEAGVEAEWQRVMDKSAELYYALCKAGQSRVAPYVVSMAYRVRFCMELNAREAMHVIELRTSPQGHPSYRRVCQTMLRLIAKQAGHHAIAEAMSFADTSRAELGRLYAERASEQRRQLSFTFSAARAEFQPDGRKERKSHQEPPQRASDVVTSVPVPRTEGGPGSSNG
jgi:thymidylate synthase ThyX